MFYYLEGKVTVIEANLAVIDIGGAGYCCYVSTNTLSYLKLNENARLYTYCNVKEDAFDIYGFHDISEKHCFEQLLSVSGVGPKAAVSILSVLTPEQFALSVISGDEKALTMAQGIGKRIAQRIVLELKDKISKENSGIAISSQPAGAQNAVYADKNISDATAALLVLGYSQSEITAALRTMNTGGMTVEEIIKQVLKGSVS